MKSIILKKIRDLISKIRIFKKLKASTLIETIIAMLIVTIAFSLALMLMLSISKNSNNSLKTKAYFLANEVLVKTKSEKTYFDQDFDYGNILIKKTVAEYENNEELFQLNISAYDVRNYKLVEQNELIIIEKSK
ncbi:MAG TPA: hypothetical protein DCG75_09980 [Bacteroidales bacterium]|nr:hypothetical protein [Bacteroidales bacterium]